MTAGEIVRTRLLALPAVTALVGTRIYLFALPQNTTGVTAIRVQRISELMPGHLRGYRPLRRARVQVDSAAPSMAQAMAIDAAALGDGAGSGLAGFAGEMNGQTVWNIEPIAVREAYDGDPTRLYKVMRDFFVTLNE